ncbi:MAG: hypothetical protein ABI165_11255 [Bryobacteraceae bacterium]
MKKILLTLALCGLSASLASATVILTPQTPYPAGTGPFTYNIGVFLPGGENFDVKDFATVYDINMLMGTPTFTPSVLASGSTFAVTMQLTGLTPSGIAPTDVASIPNISVMLTAGQLTNATGSAENLGILSFVSGSNATITGQYTSLTHDSSGPNANLGEVLLPTNSGTGKTPEPVSFILLGSGLIALGALSRKAKIVR